MWREGRGPTVGYRPGKCETCGHETDVVTRALPGIPMSTATCHPCLEAGAIPMWALVANTAALGGMRNSAPWWGEVVDATLERLGVLHEDFHAMVSRELEAEQDYSANHEEGS